MTTKALTDLAEFSDVEIADINSQLSEDQENQDQFTISRFVFIGDQLMELEITEGFGGLDYVSRFVNYQRPNSSEFPRFNSLSEAVDHFDLDKEIAEEIANSKKVA